MNLTAGNGEVANRNGSKSPTRREEGLRQAPRAVLASATVRGSNPAKVAAKWLPVVALSTAFLAGCGSGPQQDANEPSGDYEVAISQASFPRKQGLGETSKLSITVQNVGTQTVPNVTMTVDGLNYRSTEAGNADPQRPLWIINAPPLNGTTAYVNTWALGPLAPGDERNFVWSLSSTKTGDYTLDYRAGAGLNGKARAVTASGTVPAGSISVNVTPRPRKAIVDPATGEVIESGQ